MTIIKRDSHKPIQHQPRRLYKLRTILLVVMFSILILPLGSLYFFRFYENELVRKTEIELIAQAAALSATYREFIDQNTIPDRKPVGSPYSRDRTLDYYTPIPPTLDLSIHPILPPRPDPIIATQAIDPLAKQAAQRMTNILLSTQRITLAGIRLLDQHGTVIGGKHELGQSLSHVEEVQQAMQGHYKATTRERISDEPAPPIASISRGTGIRLFVALPIINNNKVHGVVYLSRTPQNIIKHLNAIKGKVALVLLLLLGTTLAIGFFITFHLARPIRQLIKQTKKVAQGEEQTVEILTQPGTYELAKLSESFAHMSQTLHKRSDYIRQFASHVSHEFKTPITSMQGALELLQEHADDMPKQQQQKFIGNLVKDTERMKLLLNRLFDLARADSLQPSSEVCNIKALLDTIQTRYAKKGLTIKHSIMQPINVIIANDALDSIFTHLFENSLQHGADSITISTEQQEAQLSLTVHDNGSGVSKANRERIFTPFFTTKRDQGGTGLGLDIASSLLQNWGGNIRLEASEQGALFVLNLMLK